MKQYEQLVRAITNDLATYYYIGTNGGTIWKIINAGTELDLQFALNEYARGHGKALSLDGKALESLQEDWAGFHNELKLVIKNGKMEDDSTDALELSTEDMKELKKIEKTLPKNMEQFIKLASKRTPPRLSTKLKRTWMMKIRVNKRENPACGGIFFVTSHPHRIF